MFYQLGRFAARHHWIIVGAWMIALALALPFAPRASSVLQPGGFLSPDAQSQQAVYLLTQNLHIKPTIVQVLFTSRVYTADDSRFAQQAQQALAALRTWPQVAGITSFTDNPRQISLDRHAAYANVALSVDSDAAPQLLPELERRLHKVPDLQESVGGGPVFYADIQAVSERDLRRAEVLAFPFAVLALLLVFRSVVAAVLPALVGGAAVVITLALLFALGHLVTLSIFVLNITTLFGLGLGVDYSLFMVSRFREELARGRPLEEAVAVSVATAGRAVTFSGLTVSIGLLGLILFPINMLSSVGLGGVLVVSMAVLAALTILPAALSILGPRINVLPVSLPPLRKSRILVADQQGFWYRLAHIVMRFPLRVFFPVLLILVVLGLPFLGVRFSSPDASILPDDVPSRQVYNLLATRFNVHETTPIVLVIQTRGGVLTEAHLRTLYEYAQRIEADPRVARVDSIVSADARITLDQYEQLYLHPGSGLDPYLHALATTTVAGNTIMMQVISKFDALDPRSQELAQTLRNTPPAPDMTLLVTGQSAANIDYVDSLYTAFPLAMLVVALVTYIVLLCFFRSLILPLKAILMNTLSILASYGALVIIFQNGFLHQLLGFTPLGFVEASSPILLFCALFGLSMDYEVFLLSRVQEAFWQTGDNRQAVALGLAHSGGIITSAAVIVIVVSACFATADMILVKALGLGMALAVALDATLVRGLLVPATMRLLGTWNWWMPWRGRRHRLPGPVERALGEASPLTGSGSVSTLPGGKR
jgi:RND superfamily putative drug exporter